MPKSKENRSVAVKSPRSKVIPKRNLKSQFKGAKKKNSTGKNLSKDNLIPQREYKRLSEAPRNEILEALLPYVKGSGGHRKGRKKEESVPVTHAYITTRNDGAENYYIGGVRSMKGKTIRKKFNTGCQVGNLNAESDKQLQDLLKVADWPEEWGKRFRKHLPKAYWEFISFLAKNENFDAVKFLRGIEAEFGPGRFQKLCKKCKTSGLVQIPNEVLYSLESSKGLPSKKVLLALLEAKRAQVKQKSNTFSQKNGDLKRDVPEQRYDDQTTDTLKIGVKNEVPT